MAGDRHDLECGGADLAKDRRCRLPHSMQLLSRQTDLRTVTLEGGTQALRYPRQAVMVGEDVVTGKRLALRKTDTLLHAVEIELELRVKRYPQFDIGLALPDVDGIAVDVGPQHADQIRAPLSRIQGEHHGVLDVGRCRREEPVNLVLLPAVDGSLRRQITKGGGDVAIHPAPVIGELEDVVEDGCSHPALTRMIVQCIPEGDDHRPVYILQQSAAEEWSQSINAVHVD